MLMACKSLEQTLKEITRSIVDGDLSLMSELLVRRQALMKEIQTAKPSVSEAKEVAELLGSIISLEQLVTGLARDKKKEIMEEMKDIKSRKKAHMAYGYQRLKGVRS